MPGKSPYLAQIHKEIGTHQHSIQIEKSYLFWSKQFILFNQKQHSNDMWNKEIEAFLSYLANHRKISSATQN